MLNSTTGLNTVLHRARREGVVRRVVPVPRRVEDRLALVERVAAAISPRTRQLLISHVSAWSGTVDMAALQKHRGLPPMP